MSSTRGPPSCTVSSRSATHESHCEAWSCGAVWSARHPVKVEAAGSNPVRTAAKEPGSSDPGSSRCSWAFTGRSLPHPDPRIPGSFMRPGLRVRLRAGTGRLDGPSIPRYPRTMAVLPTAPGGGVWRQWPGTRRALCSARTCRPRRRTGTSHGTARYVIACCGWRWSPHRVPPGPRPRPRRTRARRRHDPRMAPTPLRTRAAGKGGFSTAPRAGLTSRLVCDGCHRMSFGKCGTYAPPTKGQFNMCNCTLSGVSRTGDPTPLPRLLQGRAQQDRQTHRGRTKKIALDPAESSAIDDAPCCMPGEL